MVGWLDVENWANKLQEKYVFTCFEGLWEDFCVESNPIRGNNKVIKAVSPQNDDSAAFSQTEQEMFSQHETFLMRRERNLFFQWRKGKKKEEEIFIHLALVLHNVNIKSKEFLNVWKLLRIFNDRLNCGFCGTLSRWGLIMWLYLFRDGNTSY